MRERGARLGAVRGRWALDRVAVEPCHQAGGFAVEKAPQRPSAIGLRRGGFDSRACKMRHEVEIEGKLFRSEPFIEREHETPVIGRHEVVRVLDSRGNRLEEVNCADRVTREPGSEIL